MVKIGFTGSQAYPTDKQIETCKNFLIELKPTEFHDGACIGSDYAIHKIAQALKIKIISHPPTIKLKRAIYTSDETREEKDYLVRNLDIINETDEILAVSDSYKEKLRSGTWFTIKHALKKGKKVTIIFPDGKKEVYIPITLDRWGNKIDKNIIRYKQIKSLYWAIYIIDIVFLFFAKYKFYITALIYIIVIAINRKISDYLLEKYIIGKKIRRNLIDECDIPKGQWDE